MSKNDLVTSNKTTFVLLKCPKANTKNFVPPGIWLGPKPFFFSFHLFRFFAPEENRNQLSDLYSV